MKKDYLTLTWVKRKAEVFVVYGWCIILLSSLIIIGVPVQAQVLWDRPGLDTGQTAHGGKYTSYLLDQVLLSKMLSTAPLADDPDGKGVVLHIPDPYGNTINFILRETQLIFESSGITASDIHTYTGNTADGSAKLHLTVYPGHISGIVLQGSATWFIGTRDESESEGGKITVAVYDSENRPRDWPVTPCSLKDETGYSLADIMPGEGTYIRSRGASTAVNIKKYRLAIATTGEYTQANGTQAATLANLTALVNNLNALFERDFGISFVLVTNNSLLYTDPATDPFDPGMGACNLTLPSRDNFNAQLSGNSYDAGITIFYNNFGGCAYTGICNSSLKGGAVSGYNATDPTSYLLEVTGHELGHVFGAGHTHNSNEGGGCSFSPNTAWEPGGGSTIMAYASFCNPTFPSGNTGLYFHSGSIGQVAAYTNSPTGSCYQPGPANNTPELTTPTDDTFFIPIATPYRLFADATDPDNDNLTYTFEQMDRGTGTTATPSDTTSFGPIVRSRQPSPQPYRYIPAMDILAGGGSYPFESLPSVSRLLTFWARVRDNRAGGGTSSVDTILIRTAGTAPFAITSQSNDISVAGGSPMTVTWNVAGTNTSPFNAATVRILFAADGLNYDYVLAASVPNNGSRTVTVPNISSQNGRIMVAANDNIFFNINGGKLTITVPCPEIQHSTVWPQTALTATEGAPTLNLQLHPTFGQGTDTLLGEITASSPTGNVAFKTSANDTTGCYNGSGYSGRYDLFRFQVGQTGNYTISRTLYTLSGNLFMSAYNSQGVTATTAASCNNYLHRSNVYQTSGGVSIPSSFILPAIGDSMYYLPALKTGTTTFGTFRINVIGPAKIYTEFKNPASAYSYLVVNAEDTVISATAASPNLQSQAPGSYRVYGLSHSTGYNPAASVGQPFSTIFNGIQTSPACALVSANYRTIEIEESTPLPTRQLELQATAVTAGVQLDWQVDLVERQTKLFTLEHSRDGRDFTNINVSGPEEHRTAPGKYRYVHTGAMKGSNFYRVRQIDFEGRVSFSPVRSVSLKEGSSVELIPNPTSGIVLLKLRQFTGPLQVKVSDMAGSVLSTFRVTQAVQQVDLSHLVPGVYLLSSDLFVIKMIKN